jgi:hypothetical protein
MAPVCWARREIPAIAQIATQFEGNDVIVFGGAE